MRTLLTADGTMIDAEKWGDAWMTKQAVGVCDHCGFIMKVLETDGEPIAEHYGVPSFDSKCLQCGAEASAPRGVVRRRRRYKRSA